MSPVGKPSAVPGIRAGLAGGSQLAGTDPADAPEPAAARPAEPQARRRRRPPERPRTRRYSIDLAVPLHDFMTGYADKVPCDASEIIRTLLIMLRDDQELATAVREAIWAQQAAIREAEARKYG